MDWAKRVYKLRNLLCLSQEEFGKIISVSYNTINRWENGHNVPAAKMKRKINQLINNNCLEVNFYDC